MSLTPTEKAREVAKNVVKPFLIHGADRFDALLESAIEEALLDMRNATLDEAAGIVESKPANWLSGAIARAIRAAKGRK